MNKIKHAMVLAAGFGSRLGKLTLQIPKPFLPINGKAIIDIVLDNIFALKSIKKCHSKYTLPERYTQRALDA